jgi:hypothetical protein
MKIRNRVCLPGFLSVLIIFSFQGIALSGNHLAGSSKTYLAGGDEDYQEVFGSTGRSDRVTGKSKATDPGRWQSIDGLDTFGKDPGEISDTDRSASESPPHSPPQPEKTAPATPRKEVSQEPAPPAPEPSAQSAAASKAPVYSPAASYTLDAKLLDAEKWPSTDVLWQPSHLSLPKLDPSTISAAAPAPLDAGNLNLIDYRAAIVTAMEEMRLVYGPMPPADEARFGAKWAPLLDCPSEAAVAYLNRLNPLLSEFLAVRSAFTEESHAFYAALLEGAFAEGFADPEGFLAAGALARTHRDAMTSLGARMQLIAQAVMDLGDPPNVLQERARAKNYFFDAVDEVQKDLPQVSKTSPPAGSFGIYVLADILSKATADQNPAFKSHIEVTGSTIATSQEYVPKTPQQKGYIEKYLFSWEGIQPRILWGEKVSVHLKAEDAGSGGTTYYSASLHADIYSTYGNRADVEKAIAYIKSSGYPEGSSAWYHIPEFGRASFQVDTRAGDTTAQMHAEKDFSDLVGWGHGYRKDDLQAGIADGSIVDAFVLELSNLSSGGSAHVCYLYILDPTGDTVHEASLDRNRTTSAETSPEIQRIQYHQSNIVYFTQQVEDLHRQLQAAKDKSSRDFLQWQILAAEANLQGEKDAVTRIQTGQWVHTRTGFDNLCYWQSVRRSAEEDAKWQTIRKKISGGYRLLSLAPEDEKASLRQFLDRQFSREMIAAGDPGKIDHVVKAVADRVQGHWEHASASEEARAWEKEEQIFWAQSVESGAAMLLTGGASAAAVEFGATLAQAEWVATGAGSLYGGVTGYIEGGPGEALKHSLAYSGMVGLSASEALKGYEAGISRGLDWKQALAEAGKQGGAVFLMGKGMQFGFKGLAQWMGCKPPTLQEQFDQAKFRQQLEWDRGLVDQFQRQQWELAQAVSTGQSMARVQALQGEIRGLTSSINGSYGAKWYLKHLGSPVSQQAFIQSVGEVYEATMPGFIRNLEAMGYDTSALRFNCARNASSAGSVGMDWDLMLADETVDILRDGRRVDLATFHRDAQKAMNRAYFSQTGITATQTDISVTTTVHPEAYWDPEWLEKTIDFSRLDPGRLDQAHWVTRYKAVHVADNSALSGIQRTQELCRGGAKDMDTKLLPFLDHKIDMLATRSGSEKQVARLKEMKRYWSEIRDRFHMVGRKETDPEAIRRQMEALKALTGGKDAFDILTTMADFWQGLNKVK